MRYRILASLVLFLLAGATLPPPGFCQYREYKISGQVVDTRKQPLEGAEILLRDVATSRSYSLKTKKDGSFSFAGLPHGVYKVLIKKAGFANKEDEWRFEIPQDTMQRVTIPTVVLVSEEVVVESQRLKEAAAGVKESAEMIKQGAYDAALQRLKSVLEKNPEDPNALYLMGVAYVKKGMWAEASAPLQKVAELQPGFAGAYYQLGICYMQQKEPEKALDFFRKALELDPGNADSNFYAGLILFELDRVDEAVVFFEKTLSLKPDDPAALEMAGRCFIHQAEFQKALAYLEKARVAYAGDAERVKFLDGLIEKLKEQIKK